MTQKQDKAFQLLYNEARIAGLQAGMNVTPTPMIVSEHADPLNDNSRVVRRYAPVMDGVCGFAWIVLRPANSAFANWCKKKGYGKVGYGGGLHIWVSDFNQSMTKKEEYAHAFAAVLHKAGINAYGQSRMD